MRARAAGLGAVAGRSLAGTGCWNWRYRPCGSYAIVDIGMRMLEPHELAAAMGFPADYQWLTPDGAPLTKRDRVKMIGNACPVNTVAELIRAVVMARGQAFGMRAA